MRLQLPPSLRLTLGFALLAGAGSGCEVVKFDHGNAAAREARAEALAEAYCAVYESCDCTVIATDAVHDDPAQCVVAQTQRILAAFDQAEDDGLSFDQGCMDHLQSRYAELDCASVNTIHAQLGNLTVADNFGCALYHGDETDGICEASPGTTWSDCAAGRRCMDNNQCQPELSLGAEGDACGFNASALATDCLPGLYCDQFDGCKAAQALGEPCLIAGDGSMRCAVDLYCDPDGDSIEGICQALLGGGESCVEDQYACDGWCQDGVCLDVPGVCLHEALQPPVSPL